MTILDYRAIERTLRGITAANMGEYTPKGKDYTLVSGEQFEHVIISGMSGNVSLATGGNDFFDIIGRSYGFEVKTTQELRKKTRKAKVTYKRYTPANWDATTPADFFANMAERIAATGKRPGAIIVGAYDVDGNYEILTYDYTQILNWLQSLVWEKHGTSWIGSKSGGKRGEAVWQKTGLMSIKLPASLIFETSGKFNVIS